MSDLVNHAQHVHRVLTEAMTDDREREVKKAARPWDALLRVLAVHGPYVAGKNGETYVGCAECGDYDDEPSLTYPCGTVIEIAAGFGITLHPRGGDAS